MLPLTDRPRLLVLASTFPASADDAAPAFVRDLAAYEMSRYKTTVLVPAIPGGARRESIGELSVERFRYFPRRWETLADGAILENLRGRRSNWLQVPAFLAAEVFAVRRAVRLLRPEVLHVHWIIPQGLAALLGARGVPMVLTTLGGDVYGLRDPVSRRVIRAVLRRASAVTTMNEDMRERLIALGSDPDATFVLPMGADVDGIRSLLENVKRVRGRLLFAGRLVEKKGLGVLLQALRLLADTSIELHVVGDGPLRDVLALQAAGLPVQFLGALPRRRLAVEYGAAEVSVFPSVRAASGDQDGLPVALLEAMAAGCAVLASNLPGISEAVESNVSGLLVEPGDPARLAAALRHLLDRPADRERLGRGAAARSESYSVAAVGKRYVALLDDVRAGQRPGHAGVLNQVGQE
ncbi:MAG: glycosyltransferase [Actinomycetota bacterium]